MTPNHQTTLANPVRGVDAQQGKCGGVSTINNYDLIRRRSSASHCLCCFKIRSRVNHKAKRHLPVCAIIGHVHHSVPAQALPGIQIGALALVVKIMSSV
jgi:hypothetical protein